MSENVVSRTSSGEPLKRVADALETVVQTAKDGAVDIKVTVEKALPAVSRFLSLHHLLHDFIRGCFSDGPRREVNPRE